jgi:hypothetical protein
VDTDTTFLLGIAQIAGVFVGFGALIGSTGSLKKRDESIVLINTVVIASGIVLVAALFPIGLGQYGLGEAATWRISGVALLLLSWIAIAGVTSSAGRAKWLSAEIRNQPTINIFFWIFLEAPIQIALVILVLGLWPHQSQALYSTALILNIIQSATAMARVLFTENAKSEEGGG